MVASIYHATERFRRRWILVLVSVPMVTLIALQAAVPEEARTLRNARPAPGPVLALGQPVRALAAGRTMVAALTDRGEVVVFDLEGRVRRRISPATVGPTGGRRRGAPAASGRDGFAVSAGVLDDGDFNDPYDVDSDIEDPENLFLDESGGGRSRPPHRGRPPVTGPTIVAAGGRSVWIAGPGGLSRFDDDDDVVPRDEGRRTRSAGGGVWEALSASTDGRWVVGAHDGWVVRSGDGGETFTTLSPLGDLPGRLAISDDGTVFRIERPGSNGAEVGDHAGVVSISSGSSGNALDLATCGRQAVVLEAGGMRVISPDTTVMETLGGFPNPPAMSAGRQAALRSTRAGAGGIDDGRPALIIDERPPDETAGVACAASGDRFVAYGTRLWTLVRDGRGWSRRDELPAQPVLSAVVAGDSVWAATGAGLWVLPVTPPTEAAVPDGAEGPPPQVSALPHAMAAAGLAPPESRAAWWAAALPRIDIGFASARASDRRDVRAFVLLTFMLDGERGWARERRRLAFEDAGWRRASLGMLVSLAHPPAPGSDPIDQEERAALARVLESTP